MEPYQLKVDGRKRITLPVEAIESLKLESDHNVYLSILNDGRVVIENVSQMVRRYRRANPASRI